MLTLVILSITTHSCLIMKRWQGWVGTWYMNSESWHILRCNLYYHYYWIQWILLISTNLARQLINYNYIIVPFIVFLVPYCGGIDRPLAALPFWKKWQRYKDHLHRWIHMGCEQNRALPIYIPIAQPKIVTNFILECTQIKPFYTHLQSEW